MTLEEYRNQQHEIDLVFFHGIFKTQNAHGGRNVMPRCLSEGVDIFSKSVERQGRANRTFKASGCCHGWQLEPCPYGLEPLLTFRQKIPTGRPYIETCVSHAPGVRGLYGTPTIRAMHSIHKCVAKGAPHLFH